MLANNTKSVIIIMKIIWRNIMLPIQRAVDIAGGQTALAVICGVKQQQVWNWINRQGQPPGQHCLPIAAATGVSVEELRPDIFRTIQAVQSKAVA